MKTTSILESIRNKMKKIENNDTEAEKNSDPEKPVEPHDDFEYIDDTSKDAIESKHNARNTNMASGKSDGLESDDDFDFLSEDVEEEYNKPKKIAPILPVSPPEKPMNDSKLDKVPTKKDNYFDHDDLHDLDHDELDHDELDHKDLDEHDDLDDHENLDHDSDDHENLDDYDDFDLEEDHSDLKETAKPKKSILDDLDLDDIDVDDFEPKKNEISKTQENQKDTLDLEKIFEEESMPETPKIKIPKVETPEIEEKNTSASQQPLKAQDDDIFKDDELDAPPSKPMTVQNNYQESGKENMANMANLNKSTIISEEIAKQTSNTIKDIIKSVPKTSQNHQVLSNSSPAFRSGETIEEMVAAILAPKLEQWINENLPSMVEKIVRKEIKRLLPEHEQD